MPEVEIGKITHYFGHIQCAAIELTDSLSVGDTIHIVGHTTNCELKLDSIQVEHQNVSVAKAGDAVGIKVTEHVRPHDKVFKIVQEGGKASL